MSREGIEGRHTAGSQDNHQRGSTAMMSVDLSPDVAPKTQSGKITAWSSWCVRAGGMG